MKLDQSRTPKMNVSTALCSYNFRNRERESRIYVIFQPIRSNWLALLFKMLEENASASRFLLISIIYCPCLRAVNEPTLKESKTQFKHFSQKYRAHLKKWLLNLYFQFFNFFCHGIGKFGSKF